MSIADLRGNAPDFDGRAKDSDWNANASNATGDTELKNNGAQPLRAGLGDLPGGRIVLSWGQRRLWLMDQIEGASGSFNIAFGIHLRVPIRIDTLKSALVSIFDRHTPLRTIVENIDGLPYGRILPTPRPEQFFASEDLSHLAPEIRQRELNDRYVAEAARPFHLAEDYLLRTRIIRLDEEDFVLVVILHHSAGDGISVSVLARELLNTYQILILDGCASVPASPIRYADYAAWQQDWLERSGILARQIAYWRDRLAGAPELLTLPTDHPRTTDRARRAGYEPVRLEIEVVQRLDSIARHNRTTVYAVVLSCYAAMLGRLAGLDDVVVGTPVAGRQAAEAEGLVGFFVNMLPLRIDLSGNPNSVTLIKRVRNVVLDALDNQDVPFERLVQELPHHRSRVSTPLFQAVFAWQPPTLVGTELQADIFFLPLPRAQYDLALFLTAQPDGSYSGSLEYDSSLFTPTTMKQWCEYLRHVLEELTSDLVESPKPILPAYLRIPMPAEVTTKLPSTNSGRIERLALQEQSPSDGTLTETEQRLAKIWQEILSVDEVRKTDDFFDLGGHSLLAVRLVAAVQAEFGCRINLAELFEAPTLESYALKIERVDKDAFDFRKVVRLYPASKHRQIFGINSTGAYFHLAKLLGPEWPLTSLQIFNPSIAVDEMPRDIETIAEIYVRLIRELQPNGPYRLLAWCAGGVLAAEIAQQLLAAGQAVSFLGLIEAYAPVRYERFHQVRSFLAANSFRVQWNIAELKKVLKGKKSPVEFLTRRQSLQTASRFVKFLRFSMPKEEAAEYELWLMTEYLVGAAGEYQIKTFPGKIHLYKATEMPKGMFLDELNGWGAHAWDGVQVEHVRGDHHSIFRPPGVSQLATKIRNALSEIVETDDHPDTRTGCGSSC